MLKWYLGRNQANNATQNDLFDCWRELSRHATLIVRRVLRDDVNETNENYASARYVIKLCSLTLTKLGSTWNLGEVSIGLSSLWINNRNLPSFYFVLLYRWHCYPTVPISITHPHSVSIPYLLSICQTHCFSLLKYKRLVQRTEGKWWLAISDMQQACALE